MEKEKITVAPAAAKRKKTTRKRAGVKEQTFLTFGLTSSEVEKRIEEGKINKVSLKTTKTKWEIIFSNIFTIFNFLNFAIAGWLISVASYKNTIFISLIIMNIIIGIVQELKSKKAIDSLSLLNVPTTIAIRDTVEQEIKTDEIVLGDLIFLKNGNEIPADCVIINGSIEVNESLLSGESIPIMKRKDDVIFAGSYIVSGEAYAEVNRVGDDLYIQQLSAQAKKYKRPNSQILNDLTKLIRVMTVIIIITGSVLFFRQLNSGISYEQAVIGTSGGVIGMIPSGLFFLTSVSLAIGVIKLARHKTLVQDLYCIEMLARVDLLCLDKTGTITDGTMEVKEVFEFEGNKYDIKEVISLIQGCFKDTSPTGAALNDKFGRAKQCNVSGMIPFSSERKFSAITSRRHTTSFLLGAPEFILGDKYDQIKELVESYIYDDYRVLLLANSPTFIGDETTEFSNVEALALILLEDRIREEAIDTVAYFKENDVGIKVISGDNALTASRVASKVNIPNADRYISVEKMTDKQLQRAAKKYNVFGRVSPAQKQLLIKTFKEDGYTVAMTGDGVNDILALKESDCSIAMANGSDAVRNISHLVLMDSNFAVLPMVVKEGRRVINNIQKVATLFLTKTLFSLLLVLIVIIQGGYVYPIQTIQLIYYDWPITTISSYYFAAYESNNRRVIGNFLFNVLFNAIPGALLVGLNYIVILLFSGPLNMDAATISTTVVITTSIVGFFVLYAVSQPFNRGRRIIFSVSIFVFLIMVLFLRNFFEIGQVHQLTVANYLLIAVIGQYSYIALSIFHRGSMRVKQWFINIDKWYKKYKIEKAKKQKAKARQKKRKAAAIKKENITKTNDENVNIEN